MAKRFPRKKKSSSGTGGPPKKRPATQGAAPRPAGSASTVRVRKAPGDNAWELVHPRCARDREEDLEEVRKMVDAGELDIAVDECRWLLNGCSDCLEAHRILGEIALGEEDFALARGHFGYAYRLGEKALEVASVRGNLPYRLAANRGFLESAKGLVWCLQKLGKQAMAQEVVQLALACDASDPLAIKKLLSEASDQGD